MNVGVLDLSRESCLRKAALFKKFKSFKSHKNLTFCLSRLYLFVFVEVKRRHPDGKGELRPAEAGDERDGEPEAADGGQVGID